MDAKTFQTAAEAAAGAFKVFEGMRSSEGKSYRKRMRGSIKPSGTSFKRRFLARTMMVPNKKAITVHLNGNYAITAATGPGQYFDVRFNDLHLPMSTGPAVTGMATALSGTPAVGAHGYYGLAQWLGAGSFYDSYRVTEATIKVTVSPNHDYDNGEIVIIPWKIYQGAADTTITTTVAAKDTGWASVCPFARGKVCVLRKRVKMTQLFGVASRTVDSNENFQSRYGTTAVNEGLFRVFIQKADGTAWSGNLPFQVQLVVKAQLFNSDQGNVGSSVV